MSANLIEVIDSDGWRKEYPLEKNLIYIGGAVGNDIVLNAARGDGVAARHIQLIPGSSNGGYRLVNLNNQPLELNGGQGATLPPFGVADIVDQQQIKIGGFTLIFHGDSRPGGMNAAFNGLAAAGGPVSEQKQSKSIELGLSLPTTVLSPDQPLNGKVILRNIGDSAGVQFNLELEGFESQTYELEPGPILFPNAEAELALRLHHPRGPEMLAGRHRITIRATAPMAYPNEFAEVTRAIEIMPYFSHKLRLIPVER
jgi:hypothetical protein